MRLGLGLFLSRSAGLATGPLFSDDFESYADTTDMEVVWTKGGNGSHALVDVSGDGANRVTRGASGATYSYVALTVVDGASYDVSAEFLGSGDSGADRGRLSVGTTPGDNSLLDVASGVGTADQNETVTGSFTASGTTAYLKLSGQTTTNGNFATWGAVTVTLQ